MKLGKLGSEVQKLIQPMERLGATESATTLKLLCSLFDELKDIDSEAFSEKAAEICVSSEQGLTTNQVRDILNAAFSFMTAVSASKAKKEKVQAAIRCFENVSGETSFAFFAKEIKSKLLIDVVKLHLDLLETHLGEPEFDGVFAALENDHRVNKAKLAEIASLFVARAGKSMSKSQMLKRIYARHANLVDLAKKNEWQRGRSAA
jgi:hypothetical protein